MVQNYFSSLEKLKKKKKRHENRCLRFSIHENAVKTAAFVS